jgi:two-component system, OmpR family, response regulator ChvI
VHYRGQLSDDDNACALSALDERPPRAAENPFVGILRSCDLKSTPDFLSAAHAIAASNRSSVLVVDDNKLHLELVVRIVAKAGFRAHAAEDGEQAWEALTKSKFDLLITDHEMPKLNGLDLIERLRAVSESLPCILISGCPPEPEQVIRELVYPGAYLAKPFSIRDLINTIFTVLGRGPAAAS